MKTIQARIIRETEKAALLNVNVFKASNCENIKESFREIWMPKSQIEINGETIKASDWIINAKNDELNGWRIDAELDAKTEKELDKFMKSFK